MSTTEEADRKLWDIGASFERDATSSSGVLMYTLDVHLVHLAH